MLPACYLSQAGPKLSCCFFILLRPLQPCRPRSRNRKGGRASRNKEWAESRKAEGGGGGGRGRRQGPTSQAKIRKPGLGDGKWTQKTGVPNRLGLQGGGLEVTFKTPGPVASRIFKPGVKYTLLARPRGSHLLRLRYSAKLLKQERSTGSRLLSSRCLTVTVSPTESYGVFSRNKVWGRWVLGWFRVGFRANSGASCRAGVGRKLKQLWSLQPSFQVSGRLGQVRAGRPCLHPKMQPPFENHLMSGAVLTYLSR